MFKRIAVIAGLMALAGPVTAGMLQDHSSPDLAGFGGASSSRVSSTPVVMIDFDGDILPAQNDRQDLGESSRSYKTVFVDSIRSNVGFISQHLTLRIASASPSGLGASEVAGFHVSSVAVGPATSYYLADISQSSSAPRNLIVKSSATYISTATLVGSVTFYGVDAMGRFASELIYFSSRDVSLISTMAVAHTAPVINSTGVGNLAWAYISSFTVSLSSISNSDNAENNEMRFYLNVGWGNKFGLPNDITSSTDVYKVALEGRHLLRTRSDLVVNPVYDTIVIPFGGPQGAPAGGERVDLWYRVKNSPE